jgi:hypothetical protein
VRTDIARLEAQMGRGFQVLNARLNEQGQTINAMISPRLAAALLARQGS